MVEGAHKSLRGVAKERIADFVHGNDGFGNTNPPLAEVSWWVGRQADRQRGAARLQLLTSACLPASPLAAPTACRGTPPPALLLSL